MYRPTFLQSHAHRCLHGLVSLPPAATADKDCDSNEDSHCARQHRRARGSPARGCGGRSLTGIARPTARGHMSHVQETVQGNASRCGRLACCSWGKSGDTFHTGPTCRARSKATAHTPEHTRSPRHPTSVPCLSYRRAAILARMQPCRTASLPACPRHLPPGCALYPN